MRLFKRNEDTKACKDTDKTDQRGCRVVTDLLGHNGDAIESWRVFRIMSEFVLGFELLRKYGLAATIFGSARFTPDNQYYQDAKVLSARLVEEGFTIITGGGGGVMEAANIGAYEANGRSVGLNIVLPEEQQLNPYVTDNATFDFFFSRKVMLAYASEVYIFFPGGFGTLDEFFEIITLIQTHKIEPIPVVLYGKSYWEPLLDWINVSLQERYETISPEDASLYTVLDSVEEVVEYVATTVDGDNR